MVEISVEVLIGVLSPAVATNMGFIYWQARKISSLRDLVLDMERELIGMRVALEAAPTLSFEQRRRSTLFPNPSRYQA